MAATRGRTRQAPPTDRPEPPDKAGLASRGLLICGSAMLVATAVVLSVTAVRHLSTVGAPVLPVSWCRTETTTVLAPLTGTRWFTSWQPDWTATVVVLAVAGVYFAGVSAVHRRGRRWPVWRVVSFLAGLGVCLLATTSSIAVYDMALFSAHMLGHLALVMVAPPLLVAGQPMTLALHATRNPWHVRIRRVVRSRAVSLWFCPPVALASYGVVIVGTHLTGLMDEIMTHPWGGQLEHVLYLLVGYQFFSLVVGNEPLRWRLSMPSKQLLLALAMGVDTFTGVILLQTDQPIQMTGMSPDHVDPITQTHLGGAIMWVGGDAVMALIMMGVLLAWLRLPDYRRRASRSWLEQARQANMTAHGITIGGDPRKGAPAVNPGQRRSAEAGSLRTEAGSLRDVDDNDQARLAYNEWLQRLDSARSSE